MAHEILSGGIEMRHGAWLRGSLAAASVSVLVGCAGPSSSEPVSTGSAGADPGPSAVESPAEPEAERPALEFWQSYGGNPSHEVGQYETLRAMVRWSHAIVRGKVTSVSGDLAYGDDDPGLRDIDAPLEVSVSFTGPFEVGDQVPFVVGLTERGNVKGRYAELAGDEGIFFLAESGAPRPEFGSSGLPLDERSGKWYPVTSQGVVIDDGGSAILTATGFPTDLSTIEELEAMIGEILAQA